jgi:hypothetical protein
MRFTPVICHVCGQVVLRERRRVQRDSAARVVCGKACRDALCSGPLDVEPRLCHACGEAFLWNGRHLGGTHQPGGANVCPACWRESLETPEPDGPYLDSMAGLFAVMGALLARASRVFWAPAAPCPRCGDPARRTYEWDCRHPLAVGLCEGLEGPHVHSICYRCGYETVRLQTKGPRPVSRQGAIVTVGT